MPPLIQFDHVTYRHPGSDETSLPALKDISITIDQGEWVAIVGANGSGKTTFARHCNALLLPTHGQVLIDGKSTSQATHLPQIRARIGMVFQNPEDQIVATLIEEDTAFGPENLAVPPTEIRARVQSALETVKMEGKKDRPPHLLSAGQKQRVALAGVLAMQPECVIFDESTAMLDPRGRLDVLAEMQSLHERGITVLFITHFMEEAARANRVLVLNSGSLVYDGTPQELFADQALLTDCGLEQPSTLLLLNEIRRLNPQLANLSSDFDKTLEEMPRYSGSFTYQNGISPTPDTETLITVENLNHSYLRNTPLEQQSLFNINLEVKSGLAHGFAVRLDPANRPCCSTLTGCIALRKVRCASVHTGFPTPMWTSRRSGVSPDWYSRTRRFTSSNSTWEMRSPTGLRCFTVRKDWQNGCARRWNRWVWTLKNSRTASPTPSAAGRSVK